MTEYITLSERGRRNIQASDVLIPKEPQPKIIPLKELSAAAVVTFASLATQFAFIKKD